MEIAYPESCYTPVSYLVGYSKGSTSYCRACKGNLSPGQLRFGGIFTHVNGFHSVRWYHVKCLTPPSSLASPEEIQGFTDLNEIDKNFVRHWLVSTRAVDINNGLPAQRQALRLAYSYSSDFRSSSFSSSPGNTSMEGFRRSRRYSRNNSTTPRDSITCESKHCKNHGSKAGSKPLDSAIASHMKVEDSEADQRVRAESDKKEQRERSITPVANIIKKQASRLGRGEEALSMKAIAKQNRHKRYRTL